LYSTCIHWTGRKVYKYGNRTYHMSIFPDF
jgi:hypothetical protein